MTTIFCRKLILSVIYNKHLEKFTKEFTLVNREKLKQAQFYHLNAVVPQMPGLGDFYFRNCRNISLWIIAEILCGIVSQTQCV